MSDDILNHRTDNTTRDSSCIKSPTSIEPLSFEEVVNTIETYFSQQSRDQYKFYKDGDVHVVRDEFDAVSFMNNIHDMLENCIKDSLVSDDLVKSAQIDEIFNSVNSLIKLLKTVINSNDVEYLFVVRLLSYCTSAYSKYHKSYVRYRKIQNQTGDA